MLRAQTAPLLGWPKRGTALRVLSRHAGRMQGVTRPKRVPFARVAAICCGGASPSKEAHQYSGSQLALHSRAPKSRARSFRFSVSGRADSSHRRRSAMAATTAPRVRTGGMSELTSSSSFKHTGNPMQTGGSRSPGEKLQVSVRSMWLTTTPSGAIGRQLGQGGRSQSPARHGGTMRARHGLSLAPQLACGGGCELAPLWNCTSARCRPTTGRLPPPLKACAGLKGRGRSRQARPVQPSSPWAEVGRGERRAADKRGHAVPRTVQS